MEKTKKNWLLIGLLALIVVLCLGIGFSLPKNQVETVHADLANVAVSELQIVLHKSDHTTSSTTFDGGKYLHINPSYQTVETNSSSAGADMEYDASTGVLKLYDTDNMGTYNRNISLYGLNTSDKQLTIEDYYNGFHFYNLAFEKGNLTIENVAGNGNISWQNKFKINGELTIRGNTKIMPTLSATGYNTSVNNIIEAGTLKLLDNASLTYYAEVNDNVYSLVYVNSLVLNTDGKLYLDSKDEPDTQKVLYADDVTLTKCGKITLAGPDNYTEKLTNSTYLRNAPTTPISGYYAAIIQEGNVYDGYLKTYYLIPDSTYFTVSFGKNGGTGTMSAYENVNGTIVLPICTFTPPEYEGGLEFQYWADKSNGGNTYTEGYSYTLVKDIIFYARWRTAQNHTVSFDANGGSGSMTGGSYKGAYVLPECSLTAPVGKQFKCWALGSASATTQFNAGDTYYLHGDSTITFYAVWEDAPREFTSVPSNATKQVGQTFTATWAVNFDAVEYGVNFWNGSAWQELYHYDANTTTAGTQMSYDITSDAAGEKRYAIDCYYTEFDYITSQEFTITWEIPEPTEYMYVYVTNGAEGSNDINYADEGTEITLATPASINFVALEHYHFKGWAIGAVNATPLKQPGEKITISAETYIYAIWEEDTTYSVTYYANNGSGDDVGVYGLYAGEYTLKNITEFEFDAPSGKQFKGWSYSNNGEIINTATITLDDNKELYAIWEDIPVVKYAISFNSNGGTGTMANVEYAGTYTLPTCTFVAPQGKVFAGWAYSSNGAVIATAQITVSANIELFAIWGDAQYTITVNYGTASVNSATQGTTITLTADAPQEGYEFDKWTGVGVTFANENNTTTTFVMPAGNVVVTATYKAVSAPVNPDPQVEPNPEDKGGLGAGAIVAIVLAVVVVGGVGGFALAWFVFQKKTWADLTAAIKKLGKKTGTKKSTTKKPASKKTTKSSTKETEEKK